MCDCSWTELQHSGVKWWWSQLQRAVRCHMSQPCISVAQSYCGHYRPAVRVRTATFLSYLLRTSIFIRHTGSRTIGLRTDHELAKHMSIETGEWHTQPVNNGNRSTVQFILLCTSTSWLLVVFCCFYLFYRCLLSIKPAVPVRYKFKKKCIRCKTFKLTRYSVRI